MRASQNDILDALRRLSNMDKMTLWRAARRHLRGTRFSCPEDLFHETVDALLIGDRHWPLELAFTHFMRSAMWSVAGADRELHENARALDAPIEELLEACSDQRLRTTCALDDALERERLRMADEALRAARLALSGDPVASDVIDGWMATLTPDEIRASYGLRPALYDAGRKRAMRIVRMLLAKAQANERVVSNALIESRQTP